jgi:hypothetical protein
MSLKKGMVPRRGLEPPRLAAQVPETCASTNSAIWAATVHVRGWPGAVNWLFQNLRNAFNSPVSAVLRNISPQSELGVRMNNCISKGALDLGRNEVQTCRYFARMKAIGNRKPGASLCNFDFKVAKHGVPVF